jgi:sugar phosphate isomerase/epimerase
MDRINHMSCEPALSVMWCGNVRALPYLERVRCAAKAGFNSMSIAPLDFVRFTAGGKKVAQLRQIASDHGINLLCLDPIANWTENWCPDGVSESFREFVSFGADQFFEIADQLGVKSCTAISTAIPGSMPLSQIIDGFGQLCARAAEHDLSVGLEFMPMYAVRNLETAWHILNAVQQPNAGIVFDFWHFMRGDPDFTLLGKIPGDRIFHVQFADAQQTLPVDRSMHEDCLFQRMELGTGGFPLLKLTESLKHIGGLHSVGSEIFSREFDQLDAEGIALRSGPPLAHLVAQAGMSMPARKNRFSIEEG